MKRRFGKKISVNKLKKNIRGSISIFLCLIITPFLSIVLGLVEYVRYQEAIAVADEALELSAISELASYEEYIHKRFGLLAVSQESTLGEQLDTNLSVNSSVLGKQFTIGNNSVTGSMDLGEVAVLRQQIVNFSELTVPAAILAEDFNLEQLLEKLENLTKFSDVMNTMDSMAKVTDSITNAVESLNNLQKTVLELNVVVQDTVSAANNLSFSMANLYKELSENGIALPETADLTEIESAIGEFCSNYLEKFQNVYEQGNKLVNNLNDIKEKINEVESGIDAFKNAVSSAKSAIDNVSKENSLDNKGDVATVAVATLDSVLEEMESLVNETLNDIKTNTISTAKEAVNEIIDTTLSDTGLAELSTRYNMIFNGTYAQEPISEMAKQDIIDFLKTVYTVYEDESANELVTFLENKFVPNLGALEPSVLSNNISNVLQKAKEKLESDAEESTTKLLTDLTNIVKGLFDLEVFYDSDLDAILSASVIDGSSSYQDFLDAMNQLFSSIEDYSTSGLNLIKKLKSMKNMFTAIRDLIDSIIGIAGQMIDSLVELAGSTATGDVQRLYEKVLISGYMRHNLPCRTDDSKIEIYGVKVGLKGSALTGFPFNDIARAECEEDENKMFKGAELEYIRAGTRDEKANQTICFFDIYFLRLILSLPAIFTDVEVTSIAAATTVAAWVVYILYALAEPFCDTLLLVNGQTVPFVKLDCWLTPTKLPEFIQKIGDAVLGDSLKDLLTKYTSNQESSDKTSDKDKDKTNDDSGSSTISELLELDYKSHMLIALMAFVDSDTMINRFRTIVDLETKQYYSQNGLGQFNLGKSYTILTVDADVEFSSFFNLGTSGGSALTRKVNMKKAIGY